MGIRMKHEGKGKDKTGELIICPSKDEQKHRKKLNFKHTSCNILYI